MEKTIGAGNILSLPGYTNPETGHTVMAVKATADERYHIVLAYNESKGEYATWERNPRNDEETGKISFYWGHYFPHDTEGYSFGMTKEQAYKEAAEDFATR